MFIDEGNDPSERVLTAYHEAGHAVFHCLFGDAACIDFISIQEHGNAAGRIQLRPFMDLHLPSIPRLKKQCKESMTALELRVIQSILTAFAGPVAESRREWQEPDLLLIWYENSSLIEYLSEKPFAVEINAYSLSDDFDSAFIAAVLFWGRYRQKISKILYLLAEETTRLVSDDRIWSAINAIALKILENDSLTILGDQVEVICQEPLSALHGVRRLQSIRRKLT